ncbi:hypothetical protein SHELI_v1c04650 [Spiroplasma helicoides]|uniref:Lipoprotein n=1 Tax=Spiroplasma helicoides TaxID=216938 RepID=A0A1B3SKG6_9MOLU|nr:hypothetical protein [Spiroplasma helicoides]AOG60416.1 hypothetical protein SHELI_v1c04650 [Spiroplasma helicoides]
MKRMLSLIGVFTITTSISSYAIGCNKMSSKFPDMEMMTDKQIFDKFEQQLKNDTLYINNIDDINQIIYNAFILDLYIVFGSSFEILREGYFVSSQLMSEDNESLTIKLIVKPIQKIDDNFKIIDDKATSKEFKVAKHNTLVKVVEFKEHVFEVSGDSVIKEKILNYSKIIGPKISLYRGYDPSDFKCLKSFKIDNKTQSIVIELTPNYTEKEIEIVFEISGDNIDWGTELTIYAKSIKKG